MSHNSTLSTKQPLILKYNQVVNNGIRLQIMPKYCIGYVVKGIKYIYSNNQRHIVNKGEIFYLNAGQYYLENTIGKDDAFEEILFLYSPEQLNKIINDLSLIYKFKIVNNHTCDNCKEANFVIANCWDNLSVFFNPLNNI